uniref:(California timema) hypothetical protein n=1 Tax=Timema californicum TaxID=61474 RepID=A0A7R9P3D9_TIMCA|nr:unnamed protein product [Timema californicum]
MIWIAMLRVKPVDMWTRCRRAPVSFSPDTASKKPVGSEGGKGGVPLQPSLTVNIATSHGLDKEGKRKDVGEEYLLGAPLGSRTGTPVVRLQDMPPSEGGGGEDGNWARTYYEQHPISAAANAMLNIGGPGGGNPEEQAQNMGGLIYEYYKFSGLSVGDKDKIEIWPSDFATETVYPTLSVALSHLRAQRIRVPSGRRRHESRKHFLSKLTHSDTQTADDWENEVQISSANALVVLSPTAEDGEIEVRISVGTTSTASGGPLLASQLKVANGLGGGSGHDLLAPPPGSLSGTASPGTTAELQGLLLQHNGLKTGMAYTSQMFTTMGATTHHGSGTPSPTPYADQYATTAVSQGYLTSSGAIRAPISTTAAFAVTDPYYAREYFSEQGYSSQGRQQQVPSYADSPEAGGGSTTSTASYVERYVVRPSTGYHGSKGVVSSAAAAGLTVDLPSPDSGIGTDAITPRDQTTIQQYSVAYPLWGLTGTRASPNIVWGFPEVSADLKRKGNGWGWEEASTRNKRQARLIWFHGDRKVQCSRTGSYPDLPVLSSLALHETSTLDCAATEASIYNSKSFEYSSELCQAGGPLLDPALVGQRSSQSPGQTPAGGRRPWHDFGRPNDADKIQIPKT